MTAVDGRRWKVPSRVLAGSLFALAIVVVSAVAAWPIYASSSFLLLIVVSAVTAFAIAIAARVRRWGGWRVTAVIGTAFVVLGVPLAVPSRLGSPLEVARGLGELLLGAVLAWKDLVTVDLPVASYRNLLVPALIVFLIGTCVLLLASWRDDGRSVLAAAVAIAMVSFGLFFGRTVTSAPISIGPLTLHAPVETVVGVLGLITTLLWLSWRTHDARRRALQRAAASSGVRITARSSSADRRRAALGGGMIAVAVVAAVIVVPFAAQGADRDVLRSAVGPEIDLSRAVSPLTEYRSHFEEGQVDDILFSVESTGVAPDRIRLATLTEYDGEVFRTGSSSAASEGRFVRVPSRLDAGEGEPFEATVTIDALDGLWMPTAGRLAAVDFGGPRGAALADGFYYNATTSAGVQTTGGGLASGDVLRLVGVEPVTASLDAIEAPGATATEIAAPQSLRTWVERHKTGTDGAALASLVSLLRERGYLSHGLQSGQTARPKWAEPLGAYSLQPSASGHSLGRIEALFDRLLEREADPRAEASGNYVAGIGDDEQFAVAVALIARELGFPSRVVVGTRLVSGDVDAAVCPDGACRAQDVSAWAEVLSTGGDWVPIDATPQHAEPPSLEVIQQRDPENVTDVRPDAPEEILPPDPVQQDAAAPEPGDDPSGVDLAWLGPTLRVVAASLLVLLLVAGPVVAIVIAKHLRRRARRTAGTPAERIVGGWDEYVDAATDAGREIPHAATRAELAAAFGTPEGEPLAELADRATFAGSAAGFGDEDAEAFWSRVESQRRTLTRERGFWRGVLTTVSLRSIVRPLAPASGSRTLFTERGRRQVPRPARPTP
ncbi:transglutaminase-like domain-containing protein [Microbacterium aoyamense]|uniref:Transglutaminase-like domain-containing protein n=1 Tax=Microbacterium aoyamense TaxID=344166 RepID=A0ABP5B3H6_9MICO|nr:transglutaminase domain-containing protein [Microbacterium aoyamense]